MAACCLSSALHLADRAHKASLGTAQASAHRLQAARWDKRFTQEQPCIGLSISLHNLDRTHLCLWVQTALVKEVMTEHLEAAAGRLLDASASGSAPAKQQLMGLLNGMLYTIIGQGSTLGGDWQQPPGPWAVVGQVGLLSLEPRAPSGLGKAALPLDVDGTAWGVTWTCCCLLEACNCLAALKQDAEAV